MDKQAAKMQPTKMSNDDLVMMAQKGISIDAVMNEAIRRNSISLFESLAAIPRVVASLTHVKAIVNAIRQSISQGYKDNGIHMLEILLSHKNVSVPNELLVAMALSDEDLFAVIFMSFGTPNEVIYSLLEKCRPFDTKTALYHGKQFNNSTITPNHNKYLAALSKRMNAGKPWNNVRSGQFMITSRLMESPHDKFITEMAETEMCPAVARKFVEIVKSPKIGNINKVLKNNIENNSSMGMQIAKGLPSPKSIDNTSPQALGQLVLTCLSQSEQHFDFIWEYILTKKTDSPFMVEFLQKNNGYSMFNVLWNHNAETKNMLLEIVPSLPDDFLKGNEGSEWIIKVLSEPNGMKNVRKFSKAVLDVINLPPNMRQEVDAIMNPKKERSPAYNILNEMYGRTDGNWYKTAEMQWMIVESGLKEKINMAMMIAVIEVLIGSGIWNAARKAGVDPSELRANLEKPEIVESIRNSFNAMRPEQRSALMNERSDRPQNSSPEARPSRPTPQPTNQRETQPRTHNITIDDLIGLITEHENLLPHQTPFRITNPSMRRWNNIHGFPIDRNRPIPQNRRNFLFLQNQDDVPRAIRQQFVNYSSNPSRYGLSNSPSLAEAIRRFDQENPNGKMQHIRNRLPNINFNEPLSSFI